MKLTPLSARPGSGNPMRKENLRRLLAQLAPHRFRMAVALVSLLISTGFGLVFPQLVVRLLEGIQRTHDLALLNSIAAALVGVFFLQAFFAFIESYLLAFVGERVVADLRMSLYRHVQGLSSAFFAGQRVGDLVSRLSNDVTQVRSVLTTNVATLLGQAVTSIGAFALMLHMNVRLTLFILALMPFLVLSAAFFSKKIEGASTRVQDQLAHATVIAEEGLQGTAVVKSFGREHYESQRYSNAIWAMLRTALDVARYNSQFTALMNFLAFCSIGAIIWYGGREVILGRLTSPQITGFLIYGIIIAGSLSQVASLFSQLSAALGSVQRVFELLDLRPTVNDRDGAGTLTRCEGRLTVNRVTFSYDPARPVLRDFSLDVMPGEVVALVGPSGAGKSTLFNLILRFYDPTSGSVAVDGQDVRMLRQESLRSHIGVVPQDTLLFGATIRENLLYGRLDATEQEVIAAARDANAHEFIMRLPNGYDHVLGERGSGLSGGQRQRIAIARAILRNPRILLLDEATSALDNESEELVQDALGRLMANGRTTLIVAHRLSTIKIAHRIAVVDNGRVVELGSHEELLRLNGVYARLYAMQFRPPETRVTNGHSVAAAPVGGIAGLTSLMESRLSPRALAEGKI